MKYCLITFRSVTPAQRGEMLLHQNGIDCTLQRTPRWMESRGCGYCLRVRLSDAQRCSSLLKENAIAYQKVYLQRTGSEAEEMEL